MRAFFCCSFSQPVMSRSCKCNGAVITRNGCRLRLSVHSRIYRLQLLQDPARIAGVDLFTLSLEWCIVMCLALHWSAKRSVSVGRYHCNVLVRLWQLVTVQSQLCHQLAHASFLQTKSTGARRLAIAAVGLARGSKFQRMRSSLRTSAGLAQRLIQLSLTDLQPAQ
jgi:hypothetical protein